MPSMEDLLKPIEGPNPSGENLRYVIHDAVKEARREEAVPPPGMTESDRKVSDNPLVIKLTTDALSKKTKDLWLAAWLTEAWLKQSGFPGLKDGLTLCCGLVENFWDTVYPETEDGDADMRAAPLEFVGTRLKFRSKAFAWWKKRRTALTMCKRRASWGARPVTRSDEAREARAAAIQEGKIALEVIDKCFEESTKAFYAKTEKDVDGCLEILRQLKESCDAKFGE